MKVKPKDMGVTGLIEYVRASYSRASGRRRTKVAYDIIHKRYGQEGCRRFCWALNNSRFEAK